MTLIDEKGSMSEPEWYENKARCQTCGWQCFTWTKAAPLERPQHAQRYGHRVVLQRTVHRTYDHTRDASQLELPL